MKPEPEHKVAEDSIVTMADDSGGPLQDPIGREVWKKFAEKICRGTTNPKVSEYISKWLTHKSLVEV